MIYIYGDSHALFSFKNLNLPHVNCYQSAVTMFRIGRDNSIINFDKNRICKNDIIVLVYGEVDCRCHIQRQIDLGKNEDDVIYDLFNSYIKTIKNNIDDNIIIVVGIIPPTKQNDYEIINGPILHEFPFVGKDEDRSRYTKKMNKLLEDNSTQNRYIYFNPYDFCTNYDGTMKHEMTDSNVHLNDNSIFLESFTNLYNKLNFIY